MFIVLNYEYWFDEHNYRHVKYALLSRAVTPDLDNNVRHYRIGTAQSRLDPNNTDIRYDCYG